MPRSACPALRQPLAGVRAIVIGATGACGQFVVDALVRSPSTDAVTVVVRHHRDFASEFGWSLTQARECRTVAMHGVACCTDVMVA